MKRSEWMNELERNLYVLGREERETALSYYAELINDKLESGQRESDILAGFGDPKYIAREIIANSENAERRTGAARDMSGSRVRESVIKDRVFEDDDYFTPPPRQNDAVASEPVAPPLKKRKHNVFVRVILPILGALLGAYLLYSAVVTIVDVSTKESKFYESDAAFVGMLLDIGASDVTVKTGEKYTVTYTTSAIRRVSVEEVGGKLNISEKRSLWNSWANFGHEMTITVPEGCDEFDLSLSAGSLRAENIAGTHAKITVSAGQIDLNNCYFARSDIKCSAGGIEIKNSSLGDTTVNVSAGSVTLADVKATTANATVSAGDLELERFDVQSTFEAHVSAGGISGSLAGKSEDYSVSVNVTAGSCNLQSVIRDVDKKLLLSVSAGSIDLDFAG